jgi:hypothetical protein
MKQPIKYPVTVPIYIQKMLKKDKLLFKRYLHAYIKKNHPDLIVLEVAGGKIFCIRRDEDEERKATYTPPKRRPGESRTKSEQLVSH